jgi:hypothetical protein
LLLRRLLALSLLLLLLLNRRKCDRGSGSWRCARE